MSGTSDTKRMDGAERREQIVAVAMRMFETGYSTVSIGDIAAAAGVGRPLIHHYFGTKRDLYLEVVRRLSFIPMVAASSIKGDTLDERIDASIDRFLTVAWRHRNMWVSTIAIDAGGSADDVSRILRDADQVAAERMLQSLQLANGDPETVQVLMTRMLAYGAMAKYTTRLWLKEQLLSRLEAHRLLTSTLRTVLDDALTPHPDGAGPAEAGTLLTSGGSVG